MKDWRVSIMAIAGLVLLELMALYKGIDGLMLTTVLVIIAAIAGVSVSIIKDVVNGRKR